MEIEDKDVEAWLSECRTKTTRDSYRYGIDLFFKWLGVLHHITPTQWKTLASKDMKHLALEFQNSEPKGEGRVYKSKRKRGFRTREPKPLSKNAINGVLTAIQSFSMYLEKPLLLRGKRCGIEDDNHSHYFANGDLARIFDVSDLKGKAIISCAASLGWECKDFLALDRTLVENHIKKAEKDGKEYVFFETRRSKTNVPRLAVLNPLAISSLKEWLAFSTHPTLFDMTKSGLTKFMQATARKANLITTGSVRFHRIRAWTFNSLLKAGFSDMEAKYIVGKAIPHSDGTYVRLQQGIEEKYPRLYEGYLNIKPSPVGKAEVKLEQQKSEIDELRAHVNNLEKMIMAGVQLGAFQMGHKLDPETVESIRKNLKDVKIEER